MIFRQFLYNLYDILFCLETQVLLRSDHSGERRHYLEYLDRGLRTSRAMNLSEAIARVEDTMAFISNRYRPRLGTPIQIEALYILTSCILFIMKFWA